MLEPSTSQNYFVQIRQKMKKLMLEFYLDFKQLVIQYLTLKLESINNKLMDHFRIVITTYV